MAKLCAFCKEAMRPGPNKKKYCNENCRWNAWSKRNPRKTTNPIKDDRLANEVIVKVPETQN